MGLDGDVMSAEPIPAKLIDKHLLVIIIGWRAQPPTLRAWLPLQMINLLNRLL